MLRATDVTKQFGGLLAVDDVSFSIEAGELVGLIGPNGAGKTTLFNAITGVHPPTSGSIEFDGTELTEMPTHEIARLGIHRTFQTPRTFDGSTVLDNAVVGAAFGTAESVPMETARERGRESLAFVGLEDRAAEPAGSLTIADRKLLELAKGLAAQPRLLLADEIAAGLTPAEIETITETLRRARSERGIAVFWIEHIIETIMAASDRIVVLNQGRKIADGPPETIRDDPAVAEAYLGEATA